MNFLWPHFNEYIILSRNFFAQVMMLSPGNTMVDKIRTVLALVGIW